MSGIVRGFVDEMDWYTADTEGTQALEVHQESDDYFGTPVAVVPLDDATLAGMAETMARVDFECSAIFDDDFDKCPPEQRAAFLAVALKGLRAALGLEGGA